MNTETETLRQM